MSGLKIFAVALAASAALLAGGCASNPQRVEWRHASGDQSRFSLDFGECRDQAIAATRDLGFDRNFGLPGAPTLPGTPGYQGFQSPTDQQMDRLTRRQRMIDRCMAAHGYTRHTLPN